MNKMKFKFKTVKKITKKMSRLKNTEYKNNNNNFFICNKMKIKNRIKKKMNLIKTNLKKVSKKLRVKT